MAVVVMDESDLATLINSAVESVETKLQSRFDMLERLLVEKADEPLSAKQAATMLGCSPRTVTSRIASGELVGTVSGKSYCTTRANVLRFIESGKNGSSLNERNKTHYEV